MFERTRQLHYFLAFMFAVSAGARVFEMKVGEYPYAILMGLGNVALAVSQWVAARQFVGGDGGSRRTENAIAIIGGIFIMAGFAVKYLA